MTYASADRFIYLEEQSGGMAAALQIVTTSQQFTSLT